MFPIKWNRVNTYGEEDHHLSQFEYYKKKKNIC